MERWLLTYSDMITLLMALFIIMWAISSVNTAKFSELRQSLASALHGTINDGGESILNGGKQPLQAQGAQVPTSGRSQTQTSAQDQIAAELQYAANQAELESLRGLERRVQAYARAHGFASEISTTIDERGLVIHLLTDKLLFDTGQAVVKTRALPLLHMIARLLRQPSVVNPVRVEGNTDDVPISTPRFRSNWELSAARATAVLEVLRADGIPENRLSVAGYADQRPVASNGDADGRAKNRRVDLVVVRRELAVSGGP